MNSRSRAIRPRAAARTIPATLWDSSVTPAVGRPARPAMITIARSQATSRSSHQAMSRCAMSMPVRKNVAIMTRLNETGRSPAGPAR